MSPKIFAKMQVHSKPAVAARSGPPGLRPYVDASLTARSFSTIVTRDIPVTAQQEELLLSVIIR